MAKSSVIFDAYYLISSESPSVEDLTGCLLTIEYNDGEKDIITLTSDNITQPASNVIDIADGMVVVTSAENITYGSNTFPSIGTYFRRRENKRASSIFKGTLEKLNSKFIDTDSLPKETLKITVTLDQAISTVNSLIYHSDKTSDSIKVCLDHGGIPYVEFHFYTTDSAAANDYELLTYSGYSNTMGYMFTNAENGNLLCINGHTVSIYSSTAKNELDSAVKTTEQTLTDEEKAQARTNIGAGTQYTLPEASSSELGGVKADDATETDTQVVRKGADGKLYTAAAVTQVQSDYTQNDNTQTDYIKNRPFYEYTAVDITWDGDTAGKTEVDLTSALGFNVYLVSDATPSVEDLTGSTLTIYDGSSSMELSVSARALSENVIIGSDGYVFVILADNSELNGITFPSKGTYLVSAGGSYVSRITKKAINKIDPKFIPNGIDTLKVTVTYNSSTDTYSADKTSDDIKTCLDNGGIPYVYYNKDVYTYVGSWETGYSFRRWTGGYIFISSSSVSMLEEDLYEYTNRKVTAIDNTATDEQYPSALAVKKALNNKLDASHFIIDSDNNITGIKIKDQVNGYNYILRVKDGTFTVVRADAIVSIKVTTNPTKMSYNAGDYIDTTGMVVSAECGDGTLREIIDYTCDNYVTVDNPVFTITYTENNVVYSTGLTVNVTAFDPSVVLADFTYTDNGDGTYTITGWNGTYNGVTSTELIIPDNAYIIL